MRMGIWGAMLLVGSLAIGGCGDDTGTDGTWTEGACPDSDVGGWCSNDPRTLAYVDALGSDQFTAETKATCEQDGHTWCMP
jgi:hypothetical protein